MKARRSFGPDHECKHPWPEGCFVQCGEEGLVLPSGTMEAVLVGGDLQTVVDGFSGKVPGAYTTAFFEAFPTVKSIGKSIFLRGEGRTLLEAEDSCWRKWRLIDSCPEHVIERAEGYTNGMATCKRCGMMATLLDPSTSCKVCGKPTDYYHDRVQDDWYCEECLETHPPKGQPCSFCLKSDPPTTRMVPGWSKRTTRKGEKPHKVFMHPECDDE